MIIISVCSVPGIVLACMGAYYAFESDILRSSESMEMYSLSSVLVGRMIPD